MKKFLLFLVLSAGKSLECLYSDPLVKSVMPSEMR